MKSNFHKWKNFRNVITIGVIYVIDLFSLKRVVFWRKKYRCNHREGNMVTTMTRNKTGKEWQWKLSFTCVFPPCLRLLFFLSSVPSVFLSSCSSHKKPSIWRYLIFNKTYIYILGKNFIKPNKYILMKWGEKFLRK